MIIAVDFDGTLCEDKYPEIGNEKQQVTHYIKMLKSKGHKLILWTCREGKELEVAVEWCRAKGIIFDAINDNIQEQIKEYGNNSRKIYADCYIDDRAKALEDIQEEMKHKKTQQYNDEECKICASIAASCDSECVYECNMPCPWQKKNSPCKECGLICYGTCEAKEVFETKKEGEKE